MSTPNLSNRGHWLNDCSLEMISNSNVGLASSRGTGESQQPNGPAPTSVDRCDARIEDLLYTVLYDRQRTDRIVCSTGGPTKKTGHDAT